MGQKLHFFFFFSGTTSGHALYTAGQSLNLKILNLPITTGSSSPLIWLNYLKIKL